jgi:hypothetical protein
LRQSGQFFAFARSLYAAPARICFGGLLTRAHYPLYPIPNTPHAGELAYKIRKLLQELFFFIHFRLLCPVHCAAGGERVAAVDFGAIGDSIAAGLGVAVSFIATTGFAAADFYSTGSLTVAIDLAWRTPIPQIAAAA